MKRFAESKVHCAHRKTIFCARMDKIMFTFWEFIANKRRVDTRVSTDETQRNRGAQFMLFQAWIWLWYRISSIVISSYSKLEWISRVDLRIENTISNRWGISTLFSWSAVFGTSADTFFSNSEIFAFFEISRLALFPIQNNQEYVDSNKKKTVSNVLLQ